ncbi:MAG: dienelactone hydrolase family protein [Planctomycetes bacterium]|nr:dienelactone hydrolase family protein [Planctomycetota bacterium]
MPTVKFEPDATGHVAQPAGVIVLQEWWGIVPHIEDVCRRLARQGYIALAPDLYHGKKTLDAAEAQHLMEGLDWARATKEIQGAVKHLRAQGCEKVGVVGFCMGGALTVIASAHAGVDAAASFYGFPPDKGAVDAKAAPTVIFFGEKEEYFSVPDAQAWADGQRARGVPAEVVTYPGAGHAFFNDTRPEVYRKDAAEDAWARTLAHFQQHLRT